MVAFYVDTLGPDAIVVRLNGPGFGVFDRSREMTYQQLLRDHNIADYLLGVFKNGIDAVFSEGSDFCITFEPLNDFLQDELHIILNARNVKISIFVNY